MGEWDDDYEIPKIKKEIKSEDQSDKFSFIKKKEI